MAQGTDLFNSTKGQFTDYSTLIGGRIPDTNSWFLETFANLNNFTSTDMAMFKLGNSGVYPESQTNAIYSFLLTQRSNLKNCVVVMSFNTGSNVTDFSIAARGRVIDENNYLYGHVDNTTHTLKIGKVEAGVDTAFPTSAAFSPLTSLRQYWLVLLFVGNTVRCELWAEDPRESSSPLAVVTSQLSSADSTLFNVTSRIGVAKWRPISLNAFVDSIEVGTAFSDNTSTINSVINQKHVDIRDFIKYRYPFSYRTLKELREFHITEKAFSQTITLLDKAVSGTFNLLFYPDDTNPYTPVSIGPIAFNETDANIKTKLNTELKKLQNFTLSSTDPVKSVLSTIDTATPTMLIEFNESFGDISLLRMELSLLGRPVSFVDSTNTVVLAGQTYKNGDPVRFANVTTTSGINQSIDYYVINSSANDFQISTSVGGSAVNFVNNGTGSEVLRGNFGSIQTDELYDVDTKTSTFLPTVFDTNKYIETADPLNKSLTLDEMRVEYTYKDEKWSFYKGTNPQLAPPRTQFREGDLLVGKILSKGNRRGAHVSFSRAMKKGNGNWSVFLQSFYDAVNCKTIGPSSGSRISVVFDDFPWDPVTGLSALDISGSSSSACYLQFTCHPQGLFSDQLGDVKLDSNKVYFGPSTLKYTAGSPLVEFDAPMTSFETANVEFDFSRITGVRFYLRGIGDSSASSVKIMSVRAVPVSKQWFTPEINTIEQTIGRPETGFNQTALSLPPMVCGSDLGTIGSDIRPIDSRQSFIFQTGIINDQTYNKFMLFAREQEYEDLQRSTWLTAEYGYKGNNSYLKRYRTLRVRSTDSAGVVLFWDLHTGGVFQDSFVQSKIGPSYLPDLKDEANYEVAAIFQGNSIGFQIQELTSAEQPQRTIYDAPLVSSELWNTINGRIGWHVSVADADTYISSFNLEAAAYAVLKTKVFSSETPVEGAQLFTVDSGNKNLFEGFSPLSTEDRVYIDNQKSVSGEGSFVFESGGTTTNPGAISNQFTVNDWNHIYVEFDIWVPKTLNRPDVRPKLLLRPAEQPEGTSGTDIFSGVVPTNAPVAFDFVPGAWSHVAFDFRGTQAKNGDYFLVIVSDGDGAIEESSFRNKWWIDNVHIDTQTIEWELRSIENGSWTPFRRNVNRQYGALHLPESQIGTKLQLQAKALTQDAWIAEYTLVPKYASSGRILDNNMYILEDELR